MGEIFNKKQRYSIKFYIPMNNELRCVAYSTKTGKTTSYMESDWWSEQNFQNIKGLSMI